MQNVKPYFLRIMTSYGKNEKKKKDENDIFGVLIVTDYGQKNVQNFQNMQIEDEEPQSMRNNFDANQPTVNYL